MKKYNNKLKGLLAIAISFLAYYLAARLGLTLATLNKQASPVWPATGVAISLILFLGPRAAIGIFTAAFLSNFETGLNPFATLGVATGNSLEALFFVWVFRNSMRHQQRNNIHLKAALGVFSLILSASISATFGTSALWLSSVIAGNLFVKNWITWWIGDLLGGLFLVPIALTIKTSDFKILKLSKEQLFKILCVGVFTYILTKFIFDNEFGRPYLFLIFLVILLAANWLHSIWVYLLSLAICVYSIWQTMVGQGPFTGSNLLNDNLIHLQIFLAGLSITAIGIGGMKLEGFNYRVNLALLFGWVLSGLTFYFSYTAAISRDESNFLNKVSQSKDAIQMRMNDYIQMLEGGASFINASQYVSDDEWRLYTAKMLSTNRFPEIEGIGVAFSSTIKDRFKGDNIINKYQPQIISHSVPDLKPEATVNNPDDNFVITYVEPLSTNRAALGLNISSEKHRSDAAIQARDTGLPTITADIQLVQDVKTRSGFLIYVPIYKNGLMLDSVEERRKFFIGFVYAPVVFEKYILSAVKNFENEISFKISLAEHDQAFKEIYSTKNFEVERKNEVRSQLYLAGKTFNIAFKKNHGFNSSVSLVSSWISFFAAMTTLFLAIMLSSVQNLTLRVQNLAEDMTKEIVERKRTWQALTETSPAGIYLTDKNGLCTYVNPAWTQMTGLSQEEAAGHGWSKALHAEDVENVVLQWNKLIQGGVFSCNYRFVKNDGTIVYVAGQAMSIKDENQEITGYFGTVQDVTDLYHKQLALVTSSKMSSLGQMASGIAHEINNPLTIIQGKAMFIEKLLDKGDFDSAKVKTNIKQIYSTVQRIAKIIKGLQSFARETEGEPFQKSFVKVAVEDTLELCKERFIHHDTQLFVPPSINGDLLFWGRSEQISQVLLNLLGNAFDAANTAKEKWVKVEIEKKQDTVFISVIDSGLGIADSLHAKIFDPFFTTKEIGKGTGLGLSISRGIIDRHAGRLYLDTTKMNTTFVIELPLMKNHQHYAEDLDA